MHYCIAYGSLHMIFSLKLNLKFKSFLQSVHFSLQVDILKKSSVFFTLKKIFCFKNVKIYTIVLFFILHKKFAWFISTFLTFFFSILPKAQVYKSNKSTKWNSRAVSKNLYDNADFSSVLYTTLNCISIHDRNLPFDSDLRINRYTFVRLIVLDSDK